MASSVKRQTEGPRTTTPLSGETNTNNDNFEHQSVLESQKGHGEVTVEAENPSEPKEEEEEVHESIAAKVARLRESTWWLLGAVAIGIPLTVLAAAFPTVNVGGLHPGNFLIWLEIIWTAAWILRFCIGLTAQFWGSICDKQARWKLWGDLLDNTKWTQLCLALSLVSWGSAFLMCHIEPGVCGARGLTILRKVLLASIPTAAIFLLEDIMMETIVNLQVERMAKARRLDHVMRQSAAMTMLIQIMIENAAEEAGSPKPKPTPLQRIRTYLSPFYRCFLKRNIFSTLR